MSLAESPPVNRTTSTLDSVSVLFIAENGERRVRRVVPKVSSASVSTSARRVSANVSLPPVSRIVSVPVPPMSGQRHSSDQRIGVQVTVQEQPARPDDAFAGQFHAAAGLLKPQILAAASELLSAEMVRSPPSSCEYRDQNRLLLHHRLATVAESRELRMPKAASYLVEVGEVEDVDIEAACRRSTITRKSPLTSVKSSPMRISS